MNTASIDFHATLRELLGEEEKFLELPSSIFSIVYGRI
jgi:hypothetical protein